MREMSTQKNPQHEQYVLRSPEVQPSVEVVPAADHMIDSAEAVPDSPLSTWICRNEANFTARSARRSASPLDEEKVGLQVPMPSRDFSLYTSIHVHKDLEDDSMSDLGSEYSDMVPSLTRASSTSSSSVSLVGTDIVSVVDGGHVLDLRDGLLLLPDSPPYDADLLCPFQILNCSLVSRSIVDFKNHVFSHFQGHPLPSYAPCFLCESVYLQNPEEDPAVPWNTMLSHMVHEHFRGEPQIGIFRPKVALMRYMWNRCIISEAEFKASQMVSVPILLPGGANPGQPVQFLELPVAPSATPPAAVQAHLNHSAGLQTEAYIVTASRRNERRQRMHVRTSMHVQGRL